MIEGNKANTLFYRYARVETHIGAFTRLASNRILPLKCAVVCALFHRLEDANPKTLVEPVLFPLTSQASSS